MQSNRIGFILQNYLQSQIKKKKIFDNLVGSLKNFNWTFCLQIKRKLKFRDQNYKIRKQI